MMWRAVVSVALCFVFAGCGSEGSPESGGLGAGDSSTALPPSDSSTAIAVDACSLISPADVSALLGVTVEGTATGEDPHSTVCVWENPDNYESITLEIGDRATAVNNTLAPPEPGMPEIGSLNSEGMRFLGSGSVEFPAGGRSNLVQVAVLSMLGEEANDAAVELARKVGPQIPQ